MLDEIPYVIKEWMKDEGILEKFKANRKNNPTKLFWYVDRSLGWYTTPEGFGFWDNVNDRLNNYLESIFTYEVMKNLHFTPATEEMKNVNPSGYSVIFDGESIHMRGRNKTANVVLPIFVSKDVSVLTTFVSRVVNGRRALALDHSLKGKKVKIHPVYNEVFSQKSLKILLGFQDE